MKILLLLVMILTVSPLYAEDYYDDYDVDLEEALDYADSQRVRGEPAISYEELDRISHRVKDEINRELDARSFLRRYEATHVDYPSEKHRY